MSEKFGKRKLHPKSFLDFAARFQDEEGVASHVEEVIVKPWGLDIEKAGPDFRKLLLDLGSRRGLAGTSERGLK